MNLIRKKILLFVEIECLLFSIRSSIVIVNEAILYGITKIRGDF